MLELRNVTKTVAARTTSATYRSTLEHGTLNVLLGPTLSGKTSLMRLMAGLDKPTSGSIWFDGVDVTGVPRPEAQRRHGLPAVHQLPGDDGLREHRLAAARGGRGPSARIDREVQQARPNCCKLTPYLDRTPLNLSGGQQQRTALARAIVKNARLVLLDEPLANLDYKLREELRDELPKIFAESGAIFVYATTEPHEALLAGRQHRDPVGRPGHPVRPDDRGLPQAAAT